MYQKKAGSQLKHFDFMILDLLGFLLSLWIAFSLYNYSWKILGTETYRGLIIILSLIHICVSMFDNTYKGILHRGKLEELSAVLKHVMIVVAVMLVIMFFLKKSDALSRAIIAVMAVTALVIICTERSLWKAYIQHKLSRNPRLILLVSDISGAKRITAQFQGRMLDFRVKGIVLIGDIKTNSVNDIPVVADADTLIDYLLKNAIDEILFSVTDSSAMPPELIRQCSMMGITIHLEMASIEELSETRYEEKLAGLTVVTSYLKLITPAQAFIKRTMDIAGGIVGIILTGILFLFVAPVIYISDPGPIFYGQDRVGKNGRIFKLYKFRSMYQDADARKTELMSKIS